MASLDKKAQIARQIDAGTITRTQGAAALGVSLSAISHMMAPKQKERLFKEVSGMLNTSTRKRMREGDWKELEKELAEWICMVNEFFNSVKVGTSMQVIMAKADELAVLRGDNDFQSNKGWFWRFCKRYDFRRYCLHGEGGDVDLAEHAQRLEELRVIISGYEPHEVFNMDETGLFYK